MVKYPIYSEIRFWILLRKEMLDSSIDCNSYDQPTNTAGEGYCYGVPADQYLALVDGIIPAMVNGMDYGGSKCTFKIDLENITYMLFRL
jgi:hypothetical protein